MCLIVNKFKNFWQWFKCSSYKCIIDKMKFFIPILVLSLFLLGCTKDDDSSSNTEIEGTWKTPCYAHGSRYRIKSLSVTGSTFVDTLDIYNDSRGFFYESWNKKYFEKHAGHEVNFVQDNHSKFELLIYEELLAIQEMIVPKYFPVVSKFKMTSVKYHHSLIKSICIYI